MERARFFAKLHYLRLLKGWQHSQLERMVGFYAFQTGFTIGWRANK